MAAINWAVSASYLLTNSAEVQSTQNARPGSLPEGWASRSTCAPRCSPWAAVFSCSSASSILPSSRATRMESSFIRTEVTKAPAIGTAPRRRPGPVATSLSLPSGSPPSHRCRRRGRRREYAPECIGRWCALCPGDRFPFQVRQGFHPVAAAENIEHAEGINGRHL